uniref:E3 SUMO-protein ligase SIZ2-like isoform X2 n=1 Tax=Rhizophora mucronata TaxID=61149 RepID=A0A2P2IUV4_RHIMU
MHSRPGQEINPVDFCSLCLSLARGIDFAVANNEVPPVVQDLPSILKQVCQHRNDLFLQAAIMVLMISVKVGAIFCSPGDVNLVSSNSRSIISTVMSRFYPLMKMGQILAALEVKPGYGAYVIDFHISKSTPHSAQEKIRLFVAQADNIETSTCIISPQLVNFLLNGKGVERRTNVLVDTGPQLPTNVTGLLKYGTNILQVVGEFNGSYIIVVAFMSETPLPDSSALQDYVWPNATKPDPDSDIIEGPSRISLNCPISYTRIRTPVKGLSCKHIQCFDFSNFVDINLRRPSWRCPHCNQHVCYTDIRVDQNMVKVLGEVGHNVTDVIMSDDGSWKAVLESDNDMNRQPKKTSNWEQEGNVAHTPITPSTALPNVVDLTGDDKRDAVAFSDIEDTKPFQATVQAQPVTSDIIMTSEINQLDDDVWSFPAITNVTSPALNNTPAMMMSPVITDAVSPSLSCNIGDLGNSSLNNEYRGMTQIPRHVNRTLQALPAPVQILNRQQRPRPALSAAISIASGIAADVSPSMGPTLNTTTNQMGRQLQSPIYMNLHQGWNGLFSSCQSVQQQVAGLPTSSQLTGTFQGPSGSQNLHQQQAFHAPQIRSQSPTLRLSSPLPRTQAQQPQVGVGNTVGTPNSQNAMFTAAQQLNHMARQPPLVPVQFPTSRQHPVNTNLVRTPAMEQRANLGGVQVRAVSGTNSVELPSEESWRPTGRMRGSLSGRPFPAALRDLMIQPTQATRQVQASVPSYTTSMPSCVSSTFPAFPGNTRS